MREKVMLDYVFGANILENLTTGMYQDSKVIYREYIQNACDQIDVAIKEKLISPNEGKISIWLDSDNRSIRIEDNATGIKASMFQKTLGNIADSDKIIGENKGFRGIGRLCGLAYCSKLVFTSSSKGENVESIMECDALKMRQMINENVKGKKYTANEVLNSINKFEERKACDIDSHYFKVDLIGVNPENVDLLDASQIKKYLSFVAPVPYQNNFIYRSKIYDYAKENKYYIDEYTVKLNGEQIFKKYTTVLKEANGNKYDDIFGVDFHNFHDSSGEIIAWMWIGLSRFIKAIPTINSMRGLRLRKENIQIGQEDSLKKLFKEDRGNNYFIGEVFAVNNDLIPNSQRDYFNENPMRHEFECQLKEYFYKELHRIYHDGSILNSAYKKIDNHSKKESEFRQKQSEGIFIDSSHREQELDRIEEAKKEAKDAQKRINRIKNSAASLVQEVITQIEKERSVADANSSLCINQPDVNNKKHPRRTDKLSKYNKNERKLISKIFSIIVSVTDDENAEFIISKIEEGLQ